MVNEWDLIWRLGLALALSSAIGLERELARRLPASPYAPSALRLVYEDGRGILRRVLAACTSRDFKVAAGDVNETFD